MNQESRKKGRNGPEARRSYQKAGHQNPAQKPTAHWPTGLRLPPAKDVACFIPEDLTVILSHHAFEQLFAYAYSTTSGICCVGTVKREGERFRVERFYLVPQSGSAGHTELDQEDGGGGGIEPVSGRFFYSLHGLGIGLSPFQDNGLLSSRVRHDSL